MSQVLLQFAKQTLSPTMKFKNNFIGKTKLHQSLSMWGQNKAKASSLNTANMKYLPEI